MKLLPLICLLAFTATAQAAVSLKPVDDGGDAYKVRAQITADPEWPLDASAEVVLDQQEAGAYAVILEALRVRVVRRDQAGKETELALFTERPPIAEVPLKLVVARDRWRIRVIANDELWLTAFDDTLGPGAVAAGVSSPKLTLAQAEVQGTEPVYFADDFMREKDTTGDWQPKQGRWTMTGVSQADTNQKGGPLAELSSNPFAFRCSEAGQGALATVGEWFWDTYRVEASVRAAGDGAVGLCALLQDPNNYLAFRWSRAGGGGERQLVAVRDGRADILAIDHGGWANDQWYRLSLEIVGGHVIIQIDGETSIEADTRLFGQGRVGLWAEGVTFADFDDVEVAATETICDTFALRTQDRWRDLEGEWTQDPEAEAPLNAGLRRLTTGDGLTLTGSPQWEDYRVTAICRAEARGGFGVVACYQDPQNYLALRWGSRSAPAKWRNKLELVRVREGQETVWSHPVAFNAQLWHKLSLEAQDGFIRARVGDVPVFETFDATLGGGKAGLLGSRAVEFDQVEVTFLPPPPRVEFTKVFTEDKYMTEWAQAAGSWEVAAAPQRDNVIWH
ncbi:MAG: hypothetical protein HUU35_12430, partial [Armatimonadetes bacterium]|nr:hypothetical protein [Armatimonadota bacterium]